MPPQVYWAIHVSLQFGLLTSSELLLNPVVIAKCRGRGTEVRGSRDLRLLLLLGVVVLQQLLLVVLLCLLQLLMVLVLEVLLGGVG